MHVEGCSPRDSYREEAADALDAQRARQTFLCAALTAH